MKLLLDTHAFLWFLLNDPKLVATARARIVDPNNVVYLSPATYWEIAIKLSTGKYTLPIPYSKFILDAIRNNNFRILPIKITHTAVVATLPFHHRDPFDRLLASQSLTEQMPLLSSDPIFDAYGVTRLW